eukprot:7338206-Ditylum_brightwellii.AAC.1
MSEDSPLMTFPLVQDLEYLGINKAVDDILLGKSQPNEFIDEYTQAYLDQLVSVKGILPEDVSPIPFPTYIKEVNNLREKTSSGPSDVTLAMIKTEALDPHISQVNWQSSNFPWCT